MLDPFLEIVLSGIRAKREEQGVTLHLKMEDAKSLAQLLSFKKILPKSEKSKTSGSKKPNKQ